MTLVLIDLKVGAVVPPSYSVVRFTSPYRFVDGVSTVLPAPAPVVLDDNGQGSVTVPAGVWLVEEITPTGTFNTARVIPAAQQVNLADCEYVTDVNQLGFGPTWEAKAMQALALGEVARTSALRSSKLVDEWILQRRAAVPVLASDTSLTLPAGFPSVVKVTGSADIRNISTVDQAGHTVALLFMDRAPGKVIDDLLSLPEDFKPAQFDSITLFCDGAKWYELARATKAPVGTTTPVDPTNPDPVPGAVDGGAGPDVNVTATLDGGTAATAATDETTFEGAVSVMQVRRQTATQWATNAYVLGDGEWGFDSTNRVIKIGDGTTVWTGLVALPKKGATGDRGDKGPTTTGAPGAAGDAGVKGLQGDRGPAGEGTSTLVRLAVNKPVPVNTAFGILIRDVTADSSNPTNPTDPETPTNPTNPTNPNPNSPGVPVPQSQRGPSSLDYTPKTLPRNVRADKEYLAASTTAADIRAAMVLALSWMDANPTKWCDVLIPDGTLYGSGSGSTKTAWMKDIGSATGASGHRIRVRPAGNYGSVEIADAAYGTQPVYDNLGNLVGTGSLRLSKVNGFTFSEIYANEASFALAGCSDIGWEYSHDLGYFGVNDVVDVTATGIDLTSLVYGKPRVKNGDGAGISTLTAGYLDYITLRTSFFAPIRIGPVSSWGLKNGVPEKPHSDFLQLKGNTQVPHFYIQNSRLTAAANCIIQLGGNGRLDVQDTDFIGGRDRLEVLFPDDQEYYTDASDSVFQIFNGLGLGGHHSRRTFATGAMQAATWDNPAADVATSLQTASPVRPGWSLTPERTPAQLKMAVPDGFALWASRA